MVGLLAGPRPTASLRQAAFDALLPQGSALKRITSPARTMLVMLAASFLFGFAVSTVAPALVKSNKSRSGEAGRLVGLLVAPDIFNDGDVLESQPVVDANTEALAPCQGFPRSHMSKLDRLTGLDSDKSARENRRSTVLQFELSPVDAS